MTGMLDSQTIELPCPHCKHKESQTIGKLKFNPKLTSRACRRSFTVNANQLRAAIQKIEKSLADLKRTHGRLGKQVQVRTKTGGVQSHAETQHHNNPTTVSIAVSAIAARVSPITTTSFCGKDRHS